MSQDFQTTRWTLIFEAAKTDFKNSGPALESLCQAYWMPLYAYARRTGKSHEDAQDSIQAFFEYLLKKNLPALADKKRGRFRSFLLSSLQLFLLREYRHSTTLKRGGAGSLHIPFDEALDGLNHFSDAETPEAAFERKWAHTLVNHALEQLSSEQASSGHGERFQLIRVLLLDPTNENEVRLRLRSDHGMTEGAIRTTLFRLRSRFREIVRSEVARLVDDPAEIDDEIAHLLKSMG